jgi:glycosyltransferase involved in cell wall biosynthesis
MVISDLVSVIIPTYKQPDVLTRAIDSVLAQSYTKIEVIVVDDNDSESEYRLKTEKIMGNYKNYKNVKYIKHDKNKERSAARNTGLKFSSGNYIMFLDNDDEFLKDKVAVQVECLNSLDNTWGLCYTRYLRKSGEKTVAYCGETREGNLLIEGLKRNLFIHAGSNLMLRRDVIEEIGGFDESISINEDIEFIIRVLSKYKIAFVDKIGLIVNVHPRSMANYEQITETYLNKISNILSQISISEQKNVKEMIYLQLLRHRLFSKNGVFRAIDLIQTKKVSQHNVIRYLVHLIWRRITKKSYGFKL